VKAVTVSDDELENMAIANATWGCPSHTSPFLL